MSEGQPLVVADGLTKVFGKRPQEALNLLAEGLDKDAIHERTGQTVGVQNASFEVRQGEIFVVMGLSGSGKSTLLRLINRLIEPTRGTVTLSGRNITEMSRKDLIGVRRKDMSMVFQSFALMPHQRVWENAAFGLEVAGVPKAERRKKAESALELVGLGAYGESFPRQLSGGMQQRVGLARALAADPKILLMDEAFSALDPLIRTEMQDELLQLQRRQKLTVIFISHDLDEAMRIGDRIAIMEGGRVVQVGTPEEILRNPADDYVRSFFGGVDVSNVFRADDLAHDDAATLTASDGPGAVLEKLRAADAGYGFVKDSEGRFLGVVSRATLEKAGSEAELDTLYEQVEPLAADTPFQEVVTRLAGSSFALPVTDADGRLLGTITKDAVLETLQTRSSS